MKQQPKQKSKFKPGERLEIIWRDTSGSGAWFSLKDEMPEPPRVSQLGYFLGENADTFYLCQGIPNRGACMACEEQVLGPTAVPKGCIVSVKRL